MTTQVRRLPLAGLVTGLILALLPALGRTVRSQSPSPPQSQKMPGPLSAAHAAKPGETDCSACHAAPGKIAPAKCLVCHTEIATRIAAQTGFHRDKGEDCAVCHAEHGGREANIVPLDIAGFDHAETGADLQGAHLNVKACDTCHTTSNSLPRTYAKSYLFKVPGCRACHTPPHPGRQDQCQDCHGQSDWRVGRAPEED
jgi:hypothetical protein